MTTAEIFKRKLAQNLDKIGKLGSEISFKKILKTANKASIFGNRLRVVT